MAHPEITQTLPYAFEMLHVSDKAGVPVAVALTKATFSIAQDGLEQAEKQQPILPTGQLNGKPGESSYRYEPEYAYFKPSTDVILIANARSPHGADTVVDVEFQVGRLSKRARVFGDRFWYRSFSGPARTDAEPFSEIPLVYERAFGGWDRRHADAEKHECYLQNPVGVGFQSGFAPGQEMLPLPNIEDPDDTISDIKSRPRPLGFGFTSPDWQPRAALAGKFDKAWEESRAPLLPIEFDERFFNAASEGLVANGYLTGDETVRAVNCSHRPVLQFDLPGVAAPVCRLRIAGQADANLTGELDTVVVNLLDSLVTLTWRCHVPLPRGPEQLREVFVGSST